MEIPKMEQKKGIKDFHFLDNWIWVGSCKFLESWTGYFSSAVIVLTKTHKKSPNTRGDIFQNNFSENDEKTG